MRLLAFIFIYILSFGPQDGWASQTEYKLSAGKKSIIFNSSGITWSNFCADNTTGCARFTKIFKNKKTYGFIKILTDKVLLEEFSTYCMNSFLENKKIDNTNDKYTIVKNENNSSCSWSSGQDLTLLVWKSGLTIMLTGSEKTQIPELISLVAKARYYELP